MRLNVEVRGVCLSSCTNYLFTAAPGKRISGVVGYHGDMTTMLSHFSQEEASMRESQLMGMKNLLR